MSEPAWPIAKPVACGVPRGQRVRLGPKETVRVVVAADADEDAAAAAAQLRRRLAAMLQRFPGDFQQQPLLRIQAEGLTRGDAEECWIEPIDIIEPGAVTAVDPARRSRPRIEQRLRIVA